MIVPKFPGSRISSKAKINGSSKSGDVYLGSLNTAKTSWGVFKALICANCLELVSKHKLGGRKASNSWTVIRIRKT